MDRIQVGGWVLECDPQATRVALAAVSQGAPEACGCLYCHNFVAAREAVYGPEARILLAGLGIRVDREAEVYEIGPAERWGFRNYAGWFHAVGRVVRDPLIDEAPMGEPFTALGSTLRVYFTNKASLVPAPFRDQQVVQIEFEAEVPWVIAESVPED